MGEVVSKLVGVVPNITEQELKAINFAMTLAVIY